MKTLTILAIGGLMLAPLAAQAQQAAPAAPAATAKPTAGAKIYDTAGLEVGTVQSVTADAAVVSTGTNTVALPLTSIGTGPKGLAIAMSKADLDAAASKAKADAAGALTAKLVAGTTVKSVDNTTVVGTIKAADPQYVTLTTAKGDVKLPATGFAAGPDGGIIIGMTAAQFDTAVTGAAAAATPAADTAAPTPTKAATTKPAATTPSQTGAAPKPR